MDVEDRIRAKHFEDKEQLEFIFSNEDRIIVTAPAGCGKTTAMISKIARELCMGRVLGNKKVLAMTFSVNAAIRIKDSVKELLPDILDEYMAKTLLQKIDIANYHNFAMRLLYKYGYVLNSNLIELSDFQIVDDITVLNRHWLTAKDEFEFEIFNKAIVEIRYDDLFASIDSYWNILSKTLINHKIITYNGILVAALKLLSIKNISLFYCNYYQMIIIDEFQDTNLLGYLLVDKLIANNRVCFLGDDIQKIYGFLGAIDNVLGKASLKYNAKTIKFKNNYRFAKNGRMKTIDLLIRHYSENYSIPKIQASLLLKKLNSDNEENDFICKGIKKVFDAGNNIAILVRAGWQGNVIARKLEEEGIPFFNALYTETDVEYIKFYEIANEEYHKNVSGKAVQSALRNCLSAIREREGEIYTDKSKKYIFDSLYKLLEKLFEVSRTWNGTSQERFVNIAFSLGNKGLKHMMEYLDETVILTTIHSSKGLEWDYVIIPQMNASAFPSWKYVCKPCHEVNGCEENYNYCVSKFVPSMERSFKEELNAFYVAITRAKKDVFITVNTGLNQWKHVKKTSCLINLPGLLHQDFEWDEYIV